MTNCPIEEQEEIVCVSGNSSDPVLSLRLALQHGNKPRTLFFLKKTLAENTLDQALEGMSDSLVKILVVFLQDWCSLFKNISACQKTLSALLRRSQISPQNRDAIDQIVALSEKHLAKIEKLSTQTALLDLVLFQMG
ncbi:MAG: uncharacterized protein A8A55_1737 [Amphiamblys sp. WSBS2006]|nr:MAG: uncharacterized protein A8A55_1737 [Amphiamblys sp. WSBS2006]